MAEGGAVIYRTHTFPIPRVAMARIEFQIVQQFEREITEDGFAAVLEQVVGNLSKWVTVRIACSIEGVDGKGIRSRRFQVEIERAHKPVQPVLKQRAADLKFFGDLEIGRAHV